MVLNPIRADRCLESPCRPRKEELSTEFRGIFQPAHLSSTRPYPPSVVAWCTFCAQASMDSRMCAGSAALHVRHHLPSQGNSAVDRRNLAFNLKGEERQNGMGEPSVCPF